MNKLQEELIIALAEAIKQRDSERTAKVNAQGEYNSIAAAYEDLLKDNRRLEAAVSRSEDHISDLLSRIRDLEHNLRITEAEIQAANAEIVLQHNEQVLKCLRDVYYRWTVQDHQPYNELRASITDSSERNALDTFIEAMVAGNKITAIKALWNMTKPSIGLKEAKDFVESL